MKSLDEIDSKSLIVEIEKRLNERESMLFDMNIMMKKMEEMNKKLLKAEENKSKFMSIIKNEFNNPLASMLSLSNTLLTTSKDEKVMFIGQTIQEEAFLLNFQINNIITAAEIESGTLELQPVTVNFRDIFLQIKQELSYPIKNKQAKINLNILSEDDFSYDREKVYLILVNLLSNAIEFSSLNSTIEVNILEEVNDFKIIVKDHGEGIEESEKDKIFQRFYQAHSGMNRSHRGQGLGLSVIKDLIDFMKGDIKFDSKLGEYTIFEITIPKLSKYDTIFDDDNLMFFDSKENKF